MSDQRGSGVPRGMILSWFDVTCVSENAGMALPLGITILALEHSTHGRVTKYYSPKIIAEFIRVGWDVSLHTSE